MIPVIQRMSRKIRSISSAKLDSAAGSFSQKGRAPARAGRSATATATAPVRSVLRALKRATRLGSPFEPEVDGLRLGAGDGDVLILRSIFLLPRLDHIVARRQTLDLESALIVGDRVEGMVEDTAVRPHPLVDIALEAQRHFGLVELLERLHLLERLPDVELRVDLGKSMDVVKGPVAVENLQRLARLNAEDVRVVLAASLVEGDRFGRSGVAAGHAGLDEDEHVLERAVAVDLDFLRVDRGLVRRLAVGIGVHFQLFHLGSSPRKSDLAGDRRAAGGGS